MSLFDIVDGILYYVDPKRGDQRRAVITKSLRQQVMGDVHAGHFAGHFSGQRLYASLVLHWWWHGMSQDAADFVKSCPECAVAVGSGRRCRPPFQPIPVSRLFQILGINIMDLSPTDRGNHHVAVVQDLFTKALCVCHTGPEHGEDSQTASGGSDSVLWCSRSIVVQSWP